MAYTTIDDPSAFFQVALHASSNGNTITNDGNSALKPDLIWSKGRSEPKYAGLYDSTRGVRKYLKASGGETQVTADSGYDLTSFNTDGFSTGNNQYNTICANLSYVAWQWKANEGTRTTFSESGDNPGGGYQANTTAGFSIVDYTGTQATGTVAHGLGDVPKFIMVKSLTATRSWTLYHHKMGSPSNEKNMHLNTTAAMTDYNAEYWGGATPTSSVFSLGNGHAVNYNNESYIAYCWAEKPGYSKFGDYIGNGIVGDGPYIHTGFKPAFVMLKTTGIALDWFMYDHKRAGANTVDSRYNEIKSVIYANDISGGSGTSYRGVDFYANGFKIRNGGNGGPNQASQNYIYIAFAEHPQVTSTGIPATAR